MFSRGARWFHQGVGVCRAGRRGGAVAISAQPRCVPCTLPPGSPMGSLVQQSQVESSSVVPAEHLSKSPKREHRQSGFAPQPLPSGWQLLHGSQEADLNLFLGVVLFPTLLNKTKSGPGKLKAPFHFSFQLHMKIIPGTARGAQKEQLEDGETWE